MRHLNIAAMFCPGQNGSGGFVEWTVFHQNSLSLVWQINVAYTFSLVGVSLFFFFLSAKQTINLKYLFEVPPVILSPYFNNLTRLYILVALWCQLMVTRHASKPKLCCLFCHIAYAIWTVIFYFIWKCLHIATASSYRLDMHKDDKDTNSKSEGNF